MRLKNSAPILVTSGLEAHLAAPVGPGTACSPISARQLRRVTFVQALVFLRPTWCGRCFRGGPPQ